MPRENRFGRAFYPTTTGHDPGGRPARIRAEGRPGYNGLVPEAMTAIRWQMPNRPLRASVLRAGMLGLFVVTGVALTVRPWLELGAPYPAKAPVLFATMMVIALGFVGEHHPFQRFGSANQMTMIRGMLVALIASLVGEPETPRIAAVGAGTAVVLTALDGVDGWLARRSRMASTFGARFDTETDAVFVLVMSGLVWQHGKAGAWVLIGGMLRYAFVAAGWVLPWMARPLRATNRGKTVNVFHLVGLSVALAPFVPTPFSGVVVAATLAALSWSFAVDVGRLRRREL